ncbi:filamentous hemagglutinin N-terminal domain-containing protein [Leptolyngbya sp. AN02str]|uniref:two-partner secretion domain-containing protein n=1 Tax=Leptolyngbya sp. AN02str TaxID=3423363 RepID=UPI003D311AD8
MARLCGMSVWSGLFLHSCAIAQIVPDTTLPVPSSVVTSDQSILIQAGTQAGENLFHSFSEFSIPNGMTASFQVMSPEVQRIIARVTGGSLSNIYGVLETVQPNGTVSNADLILMNPNGIVFGPNATLNVGGAFLATTASQIEFADQVQFRANGTQSSSLLTVSVPMGLQFGQQAGAIAHSSQANLDFDPETGDIIHGGLSVQPGSTLALIGNGLTMNGGTMTAPAGHIYLGSVAANSTVTMQPQAGGWSFEYGANSAPQSMQFSNGAIATTSGSNGGFIHLYGSQIDLADGSQLLAATRGDSNGAGIHIQANALNLNSGAKINTTTTGEGNSGDIQIDASTVQVQNGAQIFANTDSSGDGGAIAITADSIVLDGTSANGNGSLTGVFTQAQAAATGSGGLITMQAGQIRLLNGAQINTLTQARGHAGSIVLQANTIEIDSALSTAEPNAYRSGLFANIQYGAFGDAGSIDIVANTLLLNDGGAIVAGTEGSGSAGGISINAHEVTVQNNSIIFIGSVNPSGDAGAQGQLTIHAHNLVMQNRGRLFASTVAGDGGNIVLHLTGNLLLRHNSDITTTAGLEQTGGNGGSITIDAAFIVAVPSEDSDITANAYVGNGGDIAIQALGIFGIQPSSQALPHSSDITASSDLGTNGLITINGLEFDSSALVNLPADVTDATQQIAQGCGNRGAIAPSQPTASEFVMTGRGGLPAAPSDVRSASILTRWSSLASGNAPILQAQPTGTHTSLAQPTVLSGSANGPLVEAQGWYTNRAGETVLLAELPTPALAQQQAHHSCS